MRELEDRENRAGYQEELEERLALAGALVVDDRTRRELEVDQIPDPDDEDLDEDELEDEEFLQRSRELERGLEYIAARARGRRARSKERCSRCRR